MDLTHEIVFGSQGRGQKTTDFSSQSNCFFSHNSLKFSGFETIPPLIISIHLKPHTALKSALGGLDKRSFETGTKQLFDNLL